MKLQIQNFAKIKRANIDIDGLTVVTGKNNTGKSTVGKILYALFNSLYDLEDKIENRREMEIYTIIYKYLRKVDFRKYRSSFDERLYQYSENMGTHNSIRQYIADIIVKELLQCTNKEFDLESYIQFMFDVCGENDINLHREEIEELAASTFDKIIVRLNKNNQIIASELITRYFVQIFGSQIQCLNNPEEVAQVRFSLKGKEGFLCFSDNKCTDWRTEINILHEAFLIDNPFILDDISDYFMPVATNNVRGALIQRLKDRLRESEKDIMDGLFDAVSAKEELNDIYRILNGVAEGDISYQNDHWGLRNEQCNDKINFENLSAGLKSFLLIKLLLEKGILKEKDVLILDEPEIHLHPEWQLLYAEIIVLLQKKFELSIIVTTHSTHFLESLEYYSKKHEICDKCKYYMTESEDGLAVFEDVTGNLQKIYKKMVTPSILLDRLKYEMDNDDE